MISKRLVKYTGGWMVIVGFVVACSPEPPSIAAIRETADSGVVRVSGSSPFSIGDVETGIVIKGRLDLRSKSRNIEYQETLTAKKDLAMVNITVNQPFPEELWLHFTIRKGGTDFEDNVVIVRGAVFLDETPIQQIEYAIPPARIQPFVHEIRVDVMAHLSSIPDTLLARLSIEAILLMGVHEIPEDISAVKTASDSTVAVRSNPVRIDFAK